MIQKQFLPYDLALKVCELSFNEHCFGYYKSENNDVQFPNNISYTSSIKKVKDMFGDKSFLAPTYQQTFNFFREDFKLNGQVSYCTYAIESCNGWRFTTDNPTGRQHWNGRFETYEDAQLSCIKYMIDIIYNQIYTNENE